MLDVVLRGGAIFDGTGAPPRPTDLGIVDDRIAAVGDLADAPAAQVIDATGRLVVPGFIDIHTHTGETIFLNPRTESKIHQGATTEVSGNCGAPFRCRLRPPGTIGRGIWQPLPDVAINGRVP